MGNALTRHEATADSSSSSSARKISAQTLKRWLHDGEEIAVFDIREHGHYGEGHLFYGISLPYSVLERDIGRLAPNRAVRLVVYDAGDHTALNDGELRADKVNSDKVGTDSAGADHEKIGSAAHIAHRLGLLGYTNVYQLEGGAGGWADAGYVLFKGVNLPSKAFGELVEHVAETPHIGATELARRLATDTPPIVLDGRPFSEFQKMSIPGARCCPNGELAYRLESIVPDDQTPIVINCAGRTRSIIGAQTLIHLGVRNPVLALENGTQGWFLEDLALAHGERARYGEAPAPRPERVAAATEFARLAGVEWVEAAQVKRWVDKGQRSVFLCDVRTAEEFAAGSLPGAQHAPGGQLQQATDQYIGVRRASVVVFDDDGIRAPITASWLRQQGHLAYVLRDGLSSSLALETADVALPQLPLLESISPALLAKLQVAGTVRIVDLRSSQSFIAERIPGSTWSTRTGLPEITKPGADNKPLTIIVNDDVRQAAWIGADLSDATRARVRLLEGGLEGWRKSGFPLDTQPVTLADAARVDYLFFTHDRHAGNKAAARQYLDWELGLLAQLDGDELASFRPLAGH